MKSMSKNGHPYRTRKVKSAKTDGNLKARLRILDRGASFFGGIPPPPFGSRSGGPLTRLNYSLLGHVDRFRLGGMTNWLLIVCIVTGSVVGYVANFQFGLGIG